MSGVNAIRKYKTVVTVEGKFAAFVSICMILNHCMYDFPELKDSNEEASDWNPSLLVKRVFKQGLAIVAQ